MGVSHPYANRYKEVAIKTASPLQLIVILYDGAIHALQEAQQHLKAKSILSAWLFCLCGPVALKARTARALLQC